MKRLTKHQLNREQEEFDHIAPTPIWLKRIIRDKPTFNTSPSNLITEPLPACLDTALPNIRIHLKQMLPEDKITLNAVSVYASIYRRKLVYWIDGVRYDFESAVSKIMEEKQS